MAKNRRAGTSIKKAGQVSIYLNEEDRQLANLLMKNGNNLSEIVRQALRQVIVWETANPDV